jgi:predicted NAD/FAD-binding protein
VRIGIVGSGVSGLVCARRLHRDHEVTVLEADDRVGGHTHTVDVPVDGGTIPVDTGFIVFNPPNYPSFSALLDELGVASAPTDMSFSFRCDAAGLEWGGKTLGGVFAQKRNLLRPGFWAMLRDIRAFGPRVLRDVEGPAADLTLGEYLDASRLSRGFVDHYLLPMAGAIWSATPARVRDFPLPAFVRFFHNHGMLRPWDAPRWRYVVGGSRTYVEALTAPFRDRIRTGARVGSIARTPAGVEVSLADGSRLWFDEVVLACHSDQALRMLADPTPAERSVLGSIPYQANDVVLHTDPSLLPRRRGAWSAWNFHTLGDDPSRVAVTYQMNILQRLPTSTPINVTLNATGHVDPSSVVGRYTYDHPVYTRAALDAQARWGEISGVRRTHYCGAYWGYGFHEDGTRSGLRVGDALAARGVAA